MEKKIIQLQQEHDQLERELQSPDVINDPNQLSKLAKKYNEINQTLLNYEKLEEIRTSLKELNQTLATETDSELKAMTEDEIKNLTKKKNTLEKKINEIINPADPLDRRDIIIEIRAGTGGEEAALFAAELFRMYSRYAEINGWQSKLLHTNRTGIGGYKEVIFEINGTRVYSRLKYESGVHRVQRVPTTEKSGRLHTSAATVAILPEAEEVDIQLKPEDLDIQTTTSSGHGGQSVNTTYSAVRIVHKPTKTVVICQDERSQKQNKEKAMQVLRSRLLAAKQEKQMKERSQKRKSHPQDRVTDHRIKKSYHNLEAILDGTLDELIDDLKQADQ